MMGNLRSVMMTLLIIGMVSVGITGCMRDTTGPVDDNDNLVSATLPDPDMSGSTYEGASIEVEMRIKVPAASVRRLMFGDIIRRMRLDSSQIVEVKTLLSSHEDCVRSAITALRDSEKAILDSAKAARQVIIDSLTAGSIDSATARDAGAERQHDAGAGQQPGSCRGLGSAEGMSRRVLHGIPRNPDGAPADPAG